MVWWGPREPDAAPPMSLARMRRAPTHPGEIFREEFLEGGKFGRQAVAARALGWSGAMMSEFVKGKHSLSYKSIVELAAYTKTSSEFWATLQMRHYLWKAMQAAKAANRRH